MSFERPSNYVGVSGVVSQEQQSELAELANKAFVDTDTVLMLGVKAVHKTQWLDVPNKYGEAWYPVGERAFADALSFENSSDNIAQMYLEPEALAADPQYAINFIRRIKQRGQDGLHIIQFDMLPYHHAPEKHSYLIHEARRDVGAQEFSVILQCHANAMAEGPQKAIEKIKRLSPDEIDWVLFDASHGTGKSMDVDSLRPFIDAAFSDGDLSRVGFGVAGGLDERSVLECIPQLLSDYPNLSWDAEGWLHKTADGSLDMDQTKRYLQASGDVLRDY